MRAMRDKVLAGMEKKERKEEMGHKGCNAFNRKLCNTKNYKLTFLLLCHSSLPFREYCRHFPFAISRIHLSASLFCCLCHIVNDCETQMKGVSESFQFHYYHRHYYYDYYYASCLPLSIQSFILFIKRHSVVLRLQSFLAWKWKWISLIWFPFLFSLHSLCVLFAALCYLLFAAICHSHWLIVCNIGSVKEWKSDADGGDITKRKSEMFSCLVFYNTTQEMHFLAQYKSTMAAHCAAAPTSRPPLFAPPLDMSVFIV